MMLKFQNQLKLIYILGEKEFSLTQDKTKMDSTISLFTDMPMRKIKRSKESQKLLIKLLAILVTCKNISLINADLSDVDFNG